MDSSTFAEALIQVTGRVQGVGFRPFIYRLALYYNLKGYVKNLGDAGVEIVVEGSKKKIQKFADSIVKDAPKVSEVKRVRVDFKIFTGRFHEFIIEKSNSSEKAISGIFPPDIGICSECIENISNPNSRWWEYPFTACAWCGPRFTAIQTLPYDRERTNMNAFPMCKDCVNEYMDPSDRRFDAQGITCSHCGPRMELFDKEGAQIITTDPFSYTAKSLQNGALVAVKGIGGIHITGLATDDEVIKNLRKRKNRISQPFAVMSPTLEDVKIFTSPTSEEVKLLTGWQRPIVLLKKQGRILSEELAPGLDRIGVMLPYTGIQLMLFKRLKTPALLMTSGNPSGVPMAINNKAAINELHGIVDLFLLHNREIVNRCDDSVLRVNGKRKAFIRRSRGYVPDPIEITLKEKIAVALGTEMSNAAGISFEGKCYLTQYLGDVISLENFDYEQKALQFLYDLLKITCNPDVIACDDHPGYMTSQLAKVISQEKDIPIITSQHHHAHIVSVCAENKIESDQPVIGVALDGAGYGSDGTIWGGEVLISTYKEYERRGHLEQIPMPGGDLCTEYPYRMLIAELTKTFSNNEICDITKNHIQFGLKNGMKELELILHQSRHPNIIKTSSAGRFLDSISALLGLNYHRTYEGEPAMKLESFANRGNPYKIHYPVEIIQQKNKYYLETSKLIHYLICEKKYRKEDIAAFSQKYLSQGIAQIALLLAEKEGINTICLSGGVFVNKYISNTIEKILINQKKIVFFNKKVPLGDGGLALGQICKAICDIM